MGFSGKEGVSIVQRVRTGVGSSAGRNLSRRHFLKLGGAGLAGAALLGAGGCFHDAAERPEGPVDIVFSFGPDETGTLEDLVDRFNQEREGEIRVEYREMSPSTDEYFRSLVSDFQAGGGDIDVIGGDVVWGGEFADNGWIEDLTDWMYRDYDLEVPDAFLDASVSSVFFRNRVWGVPWFADAGMFFYRRDLLQESGFDAPPSTWDGLKEMANKVQEESGTRHGFVFQGDNYEGGVVNALEYIWNAGGRVVTGNVSVIDIDKQIGEAADAVMIDSPQSVRGLQIARSMIEDDVAPREVTGFREQQTYETFLAGDAVFARGWPVLHARAGEEGSNVSQDQIGVAPLPVAEEGMRSFSCLGGWNLFINAASQKQDAAWEFIKFATSPEQQKTRAIEGSFLPTLRELYNDREVLEQVRVVELARRVLEENARSRPVTAYYSELSSRMAAAFNASLTGEIEPEEGAQRLQEELETIAARHP